MQKERPLYPDQQVMLRGAGRNVQAALSDLCAAPLPTAVPEPQRAIGGC